MKKKKREIILICRLFLPFFRIPLFYVCSDKNNFYIADGLSYFNHGLEFKTLFFSFSREIGRDYYVYNTFFISSDVFLYHLTFHFQTSSILFDFPFKI
ncbi:MAG: hypothetical protein RMJ67_01365 [Elusimicrobiota bacterium]|nr:hypothetical protein [Endomicrobiia bacterium]MDW8165153.1 hypothetical protein [Elusimicrobiota bacterium]